jgi:3'(2'), 5'-bisphosphate nucleotidase
LKNPNIITHKYQICLADREKAQAHKVLCTWFTGLPGERRQLPYTKTAEPTAVISRSHASKDDLQELERLGIKMTISAGSSQKFCLVAAGEADVYIRSGPTMEWDTAAGDAIARFAGLEIVWDAQTIPPYNKADLRNPAFKLARLP